MIPPRPHAGCIMVHYHERCPPSLTVGLRPSFILTGSKMLHHYNDGYCQTRSPPNGKIFPWAERGESVCSDRQKVWTMLSVRSIVDRHPHKGSGGGHGPIPDVPRWRDERSSFWRTAFFPKGVHPLNRFFKKGLWSQHPHWGRLPRPCPYRRYPFSRYHWTVASNP